MPEDFRISESAPSDDGIDDILTELSRAGREATSGFDAFGGLSRGVMPEHCPNCLSTKLLAAIDHQQQWNYFAGTARCAGILSSLSCTELTVRRARDAIGYHRLLRAV